MVARMQINLVKECGAWEFVQELIDDWHRKFVFDSDIVETVVINPEPLGTVLLHQQHTGCKWTHAVGDQPCA